MNTEIDSTEKYGYLKHNNIAFNLNSLTFFKKIKNSCKKKKSQLKVTSCCIKIKYKINGLTINRQLQNYEYH